MEVPGPTAVTPLQRTGHPGAWRTRDGYWDIVLDPTEHPMLGIGGEFSPRRVWYVYPTKGQHPPTVDTSLPVFIGGTRAWASRRDAVEALKSAKTLDVEPSS